MKSKSGEMRCPETVIGVRVLKIKDGQVKVIENEQEVV